MNISLRRSKQHSNSSSNSNSSSSSTTTTSSSNNSTSNTRVLTMKMVKYYSTNRAVEYQSTGVLES